MLLSSMYMYYSRYTNNLQESAVIKANTFHSQQSTDNLVIFRCFGIQCFDHLVPQFITAPIVVRTALFRLYCSKLTCTSMFVN